MSSVTIEQLIHICEKKRENQNDTDTSSLCPHDSNDDRHYYHDDDDDDSGKLASVSALLHITVVDDNNEIHTNNARQSSDALCS